MLQAACDQFPSKQRKDGIEHMMEVVASDLGNLKILSTVNIREAGEQRHFKSSDNISKRQKYRSWDPEEKPFWLFELFFSPESQSHVSNSLHSRE